MTTYGAERDAGQGRVSAGLAALRVAAAKDREAGRPGEDFRERLARVVGRSEGHDDAPKPEGRNYTRERLKEIMEKDAGRDGQAVVHKLDVLRFRRRRQSHGHRIYPNRNSQTQQCRPTGMAHMGAGQDRRPQDHAPRRTPPLALRCSSSVTDRIGDVPERFHRTVTFKRQDYLRKNNEH